MDASKLIAYLGLKTSPEQLARIREEADRSQITSTSNMARILIDEALEARVAKREAVAV